MVERAVYCGCVFVSIATRALSLGLDNAGSALAGVGDVKEHDDFHWSLSDELHLVLPEVGGHEPEKVILRADWRRRTDAWR
jgi:hypothetical protein